MKIFLRSLSLLMVIFFSDQVSAQSFLPYTTNPFGLDGMGAWTKPTFADLDNDGDLDMLCSSNYGSNGATLVYYENVGTAQAPIYGAGRIDYLGSDYIGGILTPTFVDLDNDGDMDVMVGVQGGASYYYKNIGTNSVPSFAAPVQGAFGLYSVGYLSSHTFADLDNDGDLDVLIGEYYGNLFYFENVGTAEAPAFAGQVNVPFGLTFIGNSPNPVFKDMDGDGKIDLLVGTENGNLFYFHNIGTKSAPLFSPALTNPFGLSNVGFQYAAPAVVDLDGDGDLDVFVGANTRDFMFFESKSAPSIPTLAEGSDSGISAIDNITNVTTPTFIGTAEIGSTVSIYEGANLLGSVLVTDGTWSITSTSLTAGSHIITSKALNVGGSSSGGTKGLTLQIMTSPPTLAIASNLSTLKIGETATITFNFTEDPGTSFAWNGTVGDVVVTGGTLGAISGTGLTRTATFTPTAETNSGIANISVAAGTYSDISGNLSITGALASLSFDTQRPALSSVNIASNNGAPLLASIGNTVTLSFTSSESIQTPVLTLAGHVVIPTVTGNNWAATYTFVDGDPNGLVTYNIAFKDLAGNIGNTVTTGTGSVTVDQSAPVAPIGLAAIPGDKQITLNWTANSEIDLDKYQILYGTTASPTMILTDVAAGTTTYSHTPVTNGILYYYRIVAIDQTGNISTPSADVDVVARANQALTFNNIDPKTYGDAAFLLGDVNSSAGLPVTYTAANSSVVAINGNMARILKAGNTLITASQAGSDGVYAASPIQQNLTVNKKELTITGVDQTKVYGTALTYIGTEFNATGLLNDDTITGVVLTSPGAAATATVAGGPYPIVPSSASGEGLDNYDIIYRNSILTVNRKALVVLNTDRNKVYGSTLAVADLGGTITGIENNDNISLTRNSTGVIATAAVGQNHPIVAILADQNGELNNYTITNPNGILTVTQKVLTVTAIDKQKFAGTTNPDFTFSYAGFANNEDELVLTTQPTISTTASINSPIGDYPITISGAVAQNYSFSYVAGTLKVKAGAPTNITLAGIALYENSASGTKAGILSSTSDDASASFTFTLVPGAGDTDNALFAINGNQLHTSASLNFENKAVYKIRVRSTTLNSLWMEKELSVNLIDVNEVPTIAVIADQNICFTTATQNIALTGISAGPETAQNITLSLSSTNANLFESLAVTGSGTTGTLTYKVKAGAMGGTAMVTVMVKDNGGIENGGVDSYSRTFVITVNTLPTLVINSDKGATISKGETAVLTATGGVNYSWTANNSIISGLNTALLTVRPRETTTYSVTASNASGCVQTQTFTLVVKEDFEIVKATNIMTPNGDGVNDKWVIDNIEFYPNNEVKIFDRSGRMVYSKKGYDNTWEGTLNGTPLAEGTYYYVIDFGKVTPAKKGFITIVSTN
ncbi:MBG domain-containing protein [Pedobacter gandavensis]|uniref:T9SS type B sorting domain-containing protein n=1 Tax=Pedobacter gandavensis TaxID=2679963 RepID=A0ABR6EUM0_9SPHI|nr:gliding motility-associated C-terminal domain-containing protein [Pedobacter gandavensis]MBB2148916.1 T9SS type B sorting domain-containing protein [Pedobacter gandavensis]